MQLLDTGGQKRSLPAGDCPPTSMYLRNNERKVPEAYKMHTQRAVTFPKPQQMGRLGEDE